MTRLRTTDGARHEPQPRPRATTERVGRRKRLTRAELASAKLDALADASPPDTAADLPARPVTRGDCADGPRPCPWYSCRHHLGIEVTRAGSLRVLPSGPDTCSLDVADRGEQTLAAVGDAMRFTRERARQVEDKAATRMRALMREKAGK